MLSLILLSSSAHAAFSTEGTVPGPTFGNGVPGIPVCGSSKPPQLVFNRTLGEGETRGVMHHFWATGQQGVVDRMWVEYYVDGETEPSVSFQPSMMCGQNYPELMERDYEYAAGGLCGKTAPVGGWWNTFPIPFYKSIRVTVRADEQDGPGCHGGYVNVRGTANLPLVMPGAGWPMPEGTKLVLQKNPTAVRQPLEFVALATLPKGQRGAIFQTSWAVQAFPVGGAAAGGGYIEGCWNFYRTADEAYPGLVVGTGVEDYFDSGYYFGADSGDKLGTLFHNALSGLVMFERDGDRESLSAYRFHNRDPLFMADGGKLTWQVGCQGHPGATKCGNPVPPSTSAASILGSPKPVGRTLSPINVTTYAWVYTFPATLG